MLLELECMSKKRYVDCMELFHDVTQNCVFLCFSLKQKFIAMTRFVGRNLVLSSSRKIRCKLSKI